LTSVVLSCRARPEKSQEQLAFHGVVAGHTQALQYGGRKVQHADVAAHAMRFIKKMTRNMFFGFSNRLNEIGREVSGGGR